MPRVPGTVKNPYNSNSVILSLDLKEVASPVNQWNYHVLMILSHSLAKTFSTPLHVQIKYQLYWEPDPWFENPVFNFILDRYGPDRTVVGPMTVQYRFKIVLSYPACILLESA